MTTDICTPTRVMFGLGTTTELATVIDGLGTRCLLVTGSVSAARSGALDAVREQLERAGCTATLHDSVQPEPTTQDVDRGVELARSADADLIIAVGGGSAIDTAKAISVAVFRDSSAELVGVTLPDNSPAINVVAVPTTAGSGAEVTRGAIITDPDRGLKLGIRGQSLLPRAAVVDPAWLLSMPQDVAAQTSFDALSHSIEGFMARRASSISRMWSREALAILRHTLPVIGDGCATRETWEEQATASLLGGYTVAHASTGYPHRIQQALGGDPRVPSAHGRGLAAVYPAWVDQLYRDLPPEPMNKIAALLGGTDLRDVIRDVLRQLDLPTSLAALGYGQEHVDLARGVLEGNLENDPLTAVNVKSSDMVLNNALTTGDAR